MDERRELLASARLYLIVSAADADVVAPALAAGVDIVQLRDKHASDAELAAIGSDLRAACARRRALLIVNDRPAVALDCGADGVHVGQDDEPVESARLSVGLELLVGVSTHSVEQISAADASGADYLGVGPVYATPTKPHVEPVGLDLVRSAATLTGKPFFAIGGIDARRAPAVLAAGATRLAVVRAICCAARPERAARILREQLDGALIAGGVE